MSGSVITAEVTLWLPRLGHRKWYSFCLGLLGGFPGGSAGKESTCNVGDLGLIPWLGRSPGEGDSCMENSMDFGHLPLEPSYHVVRKPKPHREVIASQLRSQQTAVINCQIGEWEASRWFQPLDSDHPNWHHVKQWQASPADPCPLADLWAKQMIAVVLSQQLTLWGDLLRPSRYPGHTLLYCEKACTSKSQYGVNQPRGGNPKGHFYSAVGICISYMWISLKKLILSSLQHPLSQIPDTPMTIMPPDPMGGVMKGKLNWKQMVVCTKHTNSQLYLRQT